MIRPVVFCTCLLCGALLAQTASSSPNANAVGSTPAPTAVATAKPSGNAAPARHRTDRFAGHAERYYGLMWGIDSLSVKWAEAGEVIRFSYRVLDAQKAKTLSDKRLEPSLVDERAHVKLVVPTMDKVGKLRQTPSPETGRSYWMLFSNKGGYVKRGDRVDVVIGNFHANGLVVD